MEEEGLDGGRGRISGFKLSDILREKNSPDDRRSGASRSMLVTDGGGSGT